MSQLFGITSVERDTGLSKDTLRVWERRYGFPAPLRDSNGDRAYPIEQVEKLRLIRRLIDQGKRPSKIIAASTDDLLKLLDDCQPDPVPAPAEDPDFLRLVRLHSSNELRMTLQQMLLKQGLQRFVSDTVPTMNAAVGQSWMRGELDVSEEHLYSEQLQNVLRNAIGTHSPAGGRPRILLTTFPDEQHGLGLLMVEAMLVPEGASCVSLGTQTPIADIRNAAESGRFDIVALSFSSAYPLRQALDGLQQLRQILPEGIAIWAGGAAVAGRQSRLRGVRVVSTIAESLAALGEWRARHTI